MHAAEKRTELTKDFLLNIAGEETLLPDDVPRGDGRHREEIVVPIFEQDFGDHLSGDKFVEQFQRGHFAPDAIEPAAPGRDRSQLFPGLLENDAPPGRDIGDEKNGVGNASGQPLGTQHRIGREQSVGCRVGGYV